MVVRYVLVGQDLAGVRFAISPLNELSLSLRAWRDPGRYPLYLPWLHELTRARSHLDTETLDQMVNGDLWTPDFLNPLPTSPVARLEDEFAVVAATPPSVVERDLRSLHGPGYRPPPLSRILSALEGYWERCFAPHWPRMRALLEADVTYRGREIAQRGLAAMFAGLAGRVSLVGDVVEVRLRTTEVTWTRPTAGELTLTPSVWSRNASTPISPEEPPLIIYAARGVGTLWEPQPLPSPGALAALLGTVRAGLLVQLGTPASSTELAARLGVTTTAVNQHLRALRAGGLLVSARHGRSVLYRRSEVADRLLASAV
ncbi:winged helix-turn-helix domain-containing protein [Actinoplanes sp. KI2]|uniref:ArsR/SmtB family transcription factor n=1 Tax=Actinoplanes sp. KI2 TaxID=2983315 RepID=UPI0021D589E0|nr:winged helix-turn-helix domain-containing protein [Actinoplanes sp. KI2]MCU7729136.1 winged helix-turn-helix domain-containing protein [Actinoplanes sp. KI2]